jgi:hypothetical protein
MRIFVRNQDILKISFEHKPVGKRYPLQSVFLRMEIRMRLSGRYPSNTLDTVAGEPVKSIKTTVLPLLRNAKFKSSPLNGAAT